MERHASGSGYLAIRVPTPRGMQTAQLGCQRAGCADSAEKVLLVHGAAQQHDVWAGLDEIAQVSEVVAIDMLGFGASQVPAGADVTVPGQVAVVLGALDALRWRKATLVGYSMGGAVCLLATMAQPRRISRLALIAGASLVQPIPASFKALSIPGSAYLLWLMAHIAVATGLDRLLAPFYSLDENTGRRLVAAQRRLTHDRSLSAAARQLKPAAFAHLSPFYRRIDHPVLLIHGTRDHMVPVDVAERLVQILPNAELQIFQGQGHLLHEVAENQIGLRIARFIEGTKPRRP